MLKNILLDIKSKSFLTTLVIAFIIAFFINPLAELTWNLLFSMSNRFSLFLINHTIGLILRGSILIEIYIFVFIFFIFIYLNATWSVKIKKESTYNTIIKYQVQKIGVVILSIIFILVITTHIIVSELSINFKQRMGIIATYISDEKEEELWSKWYLMESKIDYVNLNYELKNIAEKNNVKLKKPFK